MIADAVRNPEAVSGVGVIPCLICRWRFHFTLTSSIDKFSGCQAEVRGSLRLREPGFRCHRRDDSRRGVKYGISVTSGILPTMSAAFVWE